MDLPTEIWLSIIKNLNDYTSFRHLMLYLFMNKRETANSLIHMISYDSIKSNHKIQLINHLLLNMSHMRCKKNYIYFKIDFMREVKPIRINNIEAILYKNYITESDDILISEKDRLLFNNLTFIRDYYENKKVPYISVYGIKIPIQVVFEIVSNKFKKN